MFLRKLKGCLFFALLCCLLFVLYACALRQSRDDAIYQVSTIQALAEGLYDSNITLSEVLQQGDLGIGTLEGLDGELIVIDGIAYQVAYSGKVNQPSSKISTPFMLVKSFAPEITFEIEGPVTFRDLQNKILSLFPSLNYFYALRVDGDFTYVKTRSVEKQKRPFRKLDWAVKNQSVFEYKALEGTAVGFYMPDYIKGLNVAGFHFHFIDKGRSLGGHLLDLNIAKARVYIDSSIYLKLRLLSTEGFKKMDQTQNNEGALKGIERD